MDFRVRPGWNCFPDTRSHLRCAPLRPLTNRTNDRYFARSSTRLTRVKSLPSPKERNRNQFAKRKRARLSPASRFPASSVAVDP